MHSGSVEKEERNHWYWKPRERYLAVELGKSVSLKCDQVRIFVSKVLKACEYEGEVIKDSRVL